MRIGEFYPPEGHDWVPTQEIRDLEEQNGHRLEAQYQDRVNLLRAEFMLKLTGLGLANFARPAWALFSLEGAEDEGSVAMLGHVMSEGAVISIPSDEATKAGKLRCIRRELHRSEDGAYFVVEDAMIDEDGDATYIIDSIPVIEPDEGGKVTLDVSKTKAPFYFVDGELLRIGNSTDYPRFISVMKEIRPGKRGEVAPFGDYVGYEDRCFALGKIEDFYEEITDTTPYNQSV